ANFDPAQTMPIEIPARINVNTAPNEVIAALALPDAANLTDEEITKITALPRQPGMGGDAAAIYETPVWLLTEAGIDPSKLAGLDKFITTRSQVFRVQSVGYFEGNKGTSVRVEAVIDTNNARPRVVLYRNLTELGKGWKGELTP